MMSPEGTREVRVPRFMREESSLTASSVIELARLATKMERAMGWPADLECAIAYGGVVPTAVSPDHDPRLSDVRGSPARSRTCHRG